MPSHPHGWARVGMSRHPLNPRPAGSPSPSRPPTRSDFRLEPARPVLPERLLAKFTHGYNTKRRLAVCCPSPSSSKQISDKPAPHQGASCGARGYEFGEIHCTFSRTFSFSRMCILENAFSSSAFRNSRVTAPLLKTFYRDHIHDDPASSASRP